MNVGAEYAKVALLLRMDEHNHMRFSFMCAYHDIVAEMIGLRTELLIKVVIHTRLCLTVRRSRFSAWLAAR